MHISFILLSDAGEPVLEPENLTIRISKDGGEFNPVECAINNLGFGCYEADLSESQLYCQRNALIHITADECQPSIYEYTPDTNEEKIAEAVWKAKDRTLTSLTTGSQKANQTFVSRPSPSSAQSQRQGLSVKQILGGK